jgi:hypothetical protein
VQTPVATAADEPAAVLEDAASPLNTDQGAELGPSRS